MQGEVVMYADRYQSNQVNKGSLTASVGIVGGLLTAALLSSPVVRHEFGEKPFRLIVVPPAPPPPPVDRPPPPKQQTKVSPRIDQPPVLVPTDRPADVYVAPPEPGPPPILPGTGEGAGTGAVIVPFDPPKPPPPVITGVQVDARYARDFQPLYPAAERRAGNEGVVMLKVLVGVDGRVRQAEKLSAASEEFWRVTERQALGKWRFKPATRDGIPVEAWRTMTVRFKLDAED